jgi:molybdenum-dependent DNA-binding transcriptional regulator ModE
MKHKNDKSKTLERFDDAIFTAMLDAVKTKSTLRKACNRANISYATLQKNLNQREADKKNQTQEILQEIRKLANEIEATTNQIIQKNQSSKKSGATCSLSLSKYSKPS